MNRFKLGSVMKKILRKFFIVAAFMAFAMTCFAGEDWVQYGRYSRMNDSIRARGAECAPRAVFMGNSITDGWAAVHPDFFKRNNFVGRGIAGQTTAHMLARFRQDVVELRPDVVVINGGTNDIAENGGPYDEERALGNLISMAELARAHGIGVIMTSLLPAERYYWRPEIKDAPEKIRRLNGRIKEYADRHGYPYVDYYSLMDDEGRGRLNPRYTEDGVHPTGAGYDIMEEAVLAALAPSKKAAEPVVIRLWDDRRPSLTNGISEKEEKADNDNWIAMVAKPELYVYPAEKPTGMALLMCPGGGYAGVAISHEGKEMAGRMNKAGVALAVLKYRMPNGHAGVPVEDVREALRILRERGREWGIEPSKIGIGGASAGGHLASTVATHPEAAGGPVAFQVLLYPVISMKDGLTHEGSRRNLLGDAPTAEAVEYYSNELHVGSSTPQAFIVVSGDDDVVPAGNSFAYYNALRENGVAASLHVYPSGGHGWGMRPDFEYSAQWIEELTTWLQRTGARLRGQDAEK